MGMDRHSQENEDFGMTSLVSLRRMGLRDAEPRTARPPMGSRIRSQGY